MLTSTNELDRKMCIIEKVKAAGTIEEMRAEIFRLQRYDPLVRASMTSADCSGLSAEDRYTMLAYHALRAKNELIEQLFYCHKNNKAPFLERTLHKDGAINDN